MAFHYEKHDFMIDILDYQAGNMLSLYRALEFLGISFRVINSYDQINSKLLIIPGVGSFSSASLLLKEQGFFELSKLSPNERPFIIGICLGMQLLFSKGNEGGASDGLNLMDGEVVKITNQSNDLLIPNTLIGWEEISLAQNNNLNWLLKFSEYSFYHIHSYMCLPSIKEDIIATYPNPYSFIPTIVGSLQKRVLGFQFHPEKSAKKGLDFLDKSIKFAVNS